jgi:prevent-host-death family protein
MMTHMKNGSKSWQLQEAKARFSEFLDAALQKGPQVVTRRGVEEAVLVPIGEWRRLERECRPNIKELLLGDGPRFENMVPRRGRWKSRTSVDFRGPEFK